jgi:hypothetical protein
MGGWWLAEKPLWVQVLVWWTFGIGVMVASVRGPWIWWFFFLGVGCFVFPIAINPRASYAVAVRILLWLRGTGARQG